DNEFTVYLDAGNSRFGVTEDNDQVHNFPYTTPVTDNRWHHVAVVRDQTGAGGQTKLYLDGQLLATGTARLTPLVVNGLVLGQDQDTLEGGYDSTQALYA